MQNRKRFILVALLVVGCGTILFAIKEYNRKPVAVDQLDADFKLNAAALIADFNENQAAATQKFLGKTIEVSGTVRALENSGSSKTLVLGDAGQGTGIRCSLDSTEAVANADIPENQAITIKGICTGYIADDMGLGSDIVLNKCITIKTSKP